MLTDICQELRNWFDVGRLSRTFTITSNSIDAPEILDGQYFRIKGSIFNDGVYKKDNKLVLIDETFVGEVWLMAVPKSVVDLSTDIKNWVTKYGSDTVSPYSSESFAGYSRTMGNGGGSSSVPTWASVFADRLNRWRKVHV